MKRSGWLVLAAVLVVAAVLAGAWVLLRQPPADARHPRRPGHRRANRPDRPEETIVILHTNDFHGAVEPDGGRADGGLVNLVEPHRPGPRRGPGAHPAAGRRRHLPGHLRLQQHPGRGGDGGHEPGRLRRLDAGQPRVRLGPGGAASAHRPGRVPGPGGQPAGRGDGGAVGRGRAVHHRPGGPGPGGHPGPDLSRHADDQRAGERGRPRLSRGGGDGAVATCPSWRPRPT